MVAKKEFFRLVIQIVSAIILLASMPTPMWASRFVQPQRLNAFRDASVYSACQDSSGTIWFNTNFGVFTYDGIQTRMMLQHSLSRGLACNGNNLVYSVSYRGIYRFDIRYREPQILKSSLTSWREISLLADGDSLWVASENCLLVSRDDSLEVAASLPGSKFLCITKGLGKNIILGRTHLHI